MKLWENCWTHLCRKTTSDDKSNRLAGCKGPVGEIEMLFKMNIRISVTRHSKAVVLKPEPESRGGLAKTQTVKATPQNFRGCKSARASETWIRSS